MVAKSATPSASTRSASGTKPRPAWLTMNPGVSLQRTGVCPKRLASAVSASMTQASVNSPATTSTIFITGTGLKKW